VTAGEPGQSFAVHGSGFVLGSIVFWNTQPITTTYQSDTLLIAELTADKLTSVTTANVTVLNPDPCAGGVCRSVPAMPFPVAGPILTYSPGNAVNMLLSTTTDWTVQISTPQSGPTVVTLGSTDPSVAGVPAAVTIPANQTQSDPFTISGAGLGVASISANLPTYLVDATAVGGHVAADIQVGLADPTIASLSVNNLPVGSSGFDLNITGSGFTTDGGGTKVLWGSFPISGVTLNAFNITPTTLTVNIATTLLDEVIAGGFDVWIVNPGPCGVDCTSDTSLPFNVNAPTLTNIRARTRAWPAASCSR
jgi:hypothetical protein